MSAAKFCMNVISNPDKKWQVLVINNKCPWLFIFEFGKKKNLSTND